MKFKVRDHFYVHHKGEVFGPGQTVDLTADEAEAHAAQIEPVGGKDPLDHDGDGRKGGSLKRVKRDAE